jgi:hypothetical protein
MLDGAQLLFDNLETPNDIDFQSHQFIRLLGGWLMLLGPFRSLSRVAVEATSFLNPIFQRLLARRVKWNVSMLGDDMSRLSSLATLFLELLSL